MLSNATCTATELQAFAFSNATCAATPRWKDDGLVRLDKSGDMISKEDATALLEAMQSKM